MQKCNCSKGWGLGPLIATLQNHISTRVCSRQCFHVIAIEHLHLTLLRAFSECAAHHITKLNYLLITLSVSRMGMPS